MKRILIALVLCVVSLPTFCYSRTQTPGGEGVADMRVLPDVEVQDTKKNPVMLPDFGKKHLLLFYVDPDKHNQNKEFVEDMEQNHRAESDNITAYGIINLKDTIFPNGIVRSLAARRTEKNHALILTDPNHLLRDAWQLGDVNNKFAIIFVTKDRELAFFKAGEFSQEDIDEFYRIIEKYR